MTKSVLSDPGSHLWTPTGRGQIYDWTRIPGIPGRGAARPLRLRRRDLHREVDRGEAGRHAGAHRADGAHAAHAPHGTRFVVVHWSGGESPVKVIDLLFFSIIMLAILGLLGQYPDAKI